jgi:hypothetical protein
MDDLEKTISSVSTGNRTNIPRLFRPYNDIAVPDALSPDTSVKPTGLPRHAVQYAQKSHLKKS